MWGICLLTGILLLLILIRSFYIAKRKLRKNVTILVLGDVGRSPRMQYHALSFLKKDFTVDIVGYPGSAPLKKLRQNDRLRIFYMQPPPSLEDHLPRTLCYIIKTFWQCFTLTKVLYAKNIPSFVLVQNPPAIPTLPICWFYCTLMDSEFVIDWHNYAYTIMALNSSKDHYLVRFAKNIEIYFGRRSSINFCVSKAMKEDLKLKWNIQAQVLYDKPAAEFHPITIEEKHKFLLKLAQQYKEFKGSTQNATALTEFLSNGTYRYLNHRPGLLISSSSWTEDEDFSILLTALEEYEDAVEEGELELPDLICAITGKGPLKEFYMAIIKLKKFKHIKIITPWLEIEDYPKILACADLGVCLHTSSSGLDLPMKVVDMFGCELPVCAYNFNCLHELVKHNENSFVFSNTMELAAQLKSCFAKFGNNPYQQRLREKFKKHLHEYQENRWHGNWICNVLPYFNE